ncbi:hypothetical protein ACN47E_004109 [Coniothyrium glycines]
MAHTTAELLQYLNLRHLNPTVAWLECFISTTRPNTPLPAIKQTALFRLLASDITTSLAQPRSSVFDPHIVRGQVQSRTVEAIEAQERGELTKGKEIVRVVEQETENSTHSIPPVQSKGPFKLLLQDATGLKLYALDLRGIEGLHMDMIMGVKLVLRNVNLRRGVAILEPGNTQVLGGRLEALNRAWKDGRKQRMIDAVKAEQTVAG